MTPESSGCDVYAIAKPLGDEHPRGFSGSTRDPKVRYIKTTGGEQPSGSRETPEISMNPYGTAWDPRGPLGIQIGSPGYHNGANDQAGPSAQYWDFTTTRTQRALRINIDIL